MINKNSKGYHKLLVWQRAREFVILVYKYTEFFPKSEEFGLKSQLRRTVISVVLTIVEGYRRHTTKDFLHFLSIFLHFPYLLFKQNEQKYSHDWCNYSHTYCTLASGVHSYWTNN